MSGVQATCHFRFALCENACVDFVEQKKKDWPANEGVVAVMRGRHIFTVEWKSKCKNLMENSIFRFEIEFLFLFFLGRRNFAVFAFAIRGALALAVGWPDNKTKRVKFVRHLTFTSFWIYFRSVTSYNSQQNDCVLFFLRLRNYQPNQKCHWVDSNEVTHIKNEEERHREQVGNAIEIFYLGFSLLLLLLRRVIRVEEIDSGILLHWKLY